MAIIEPNLGFQNHNVIQEAHSTVTLYWAHPKLGSFFNHLEFM